MWKALARLGKRATFEQPLHPHVLRHSCGFALANKPVDTRSPQSYLGHRSISNTVKYAELAPTRFRGFWDD